MSTYKEFRVTPKYKVFSLDSRMYNLASTEDLYKALDLEGMYPKDSEYIDKFKSLCSDAGTYIYKHKKHGNIFLVENNLVEVTFVIEKPSESIIVTKTTDDDVLGGALFMNKKATVEYLIKFMTS